MIAISAALLTALFALPAWIAIAGWAVGGAGMGTLSPRLAVLMLGYSEPADQGFNSAGLNIADAVGSGTALALTGILFQSVMMPGTAPFSAVFVFALVLSVVAMAVTGRIGSGGVPPRSGRAPA